MARRVLIQAQGRLGDTRYDMRGNSPALRLGACCVVRGLDVDMTGFREALKIEGAQTARPLVLDCIIRCPQGNCYMLLLFFLQLFNINIMMII